MKEPLESSPVKLALQDKKNYANQGAEKNISANNSSANYTTIGDEKQSRIAEILNFFNLLYGKIPAENFVYLGTKQQGRLFFNHSFKVGDIEAMAEKAIELSDCGIDVWHSVNTVCIEPADGKRGDETVVSYQTAIVVDIDIRSDAHKGDPSLFVADFDEAKSFLPFTPSLIIHSGYGLHAYYIFDTPIKITDDNREKIKRRNNLVLDITRLRANGKKIDGVGDLPRIMRTPGTFNYKLGADNAPLCHIVEDSGLLFSPDQIDEKLEVLSFRPFYKTKVRGSKESSSKENNESIINLYQKSNTLSFRPFADDRDFNIFRVRRMLDFISPSSLTYDEWLAVGMALKNIGFDCSDWEHWSRSDERFKDGECESKWNGFNRDGYDIGTIFMLAQQNGYDAKATYHEWYELHPSLRPSAKRNMDEITKRELDEAIILLDTLEPENFTANDARNPDNLHAVALAQTFGFNAQAENFFIVTKKAKEIARIFLKNLESDLIEPIPETEKKALIALVDGVNIKSLRNEVYREVTEIKRAQNKFRAQQAKEQAKAEAIKHAQERKQTVEDNIQKLIELRAEYAKAPSPELAAQIQDLILDTCDAKISKNTGAITRVEATQKNADLIFTFDPYLDGLFGYDQFQQADVFLKPPIWNPDAKKGEEWKDRDDAQLQAYLRKTYIEFASEKLILNSITVYSDAHKFHEVKEFFLTLPKWDGKPRAKKLFVKFLGADDIPYVHEVTMNILTAAIARIFHPGCDYQLAPILLGEQGIGKSYILCQLFGKWYGSLVDDVSDPHAIDAIQKLWGVEIKEMAAMKKDVDANKRFIDSAKDTRRQAYARRATTIPRHCVFVITTNNKMCLTDMTGNRRYPIIVCHNKARHFVEGLNDEYIRQIWAEVFAHYNKLFADGFDEKKLALSRDAQILSDEIAEDYLRDDGMESEIRAYLDIKILPLILWYLLTREERRKFIADGRLVIIDALSEFNHRRRARGGRQDIVQRDVDLISSCLTKTQGKHWLRIEHKTIQGNSVDEFILYGSELREHICAVEIYNECFGNDKRKSPTRINEILNRVEGWSLGARIARADPAYCDQKKVFYRNEI